MAHPVHSPGDSSWHIPSAGPLFLQLFVLSQAPHNQEQYENLVLRAAEAILDINSKPLAFGITLSPFHYFPVQGHKYRETFSRMQHIDLWENEIRG